MAATTTDFKILRETALARARANPDQLFHTQVSEAEYQALRTGGALFFKCAPDSKRGTIKRALTYQGFVFFAYMPLRDL